MHRYTRAGLNKWSVCQCVSHQHLGWLEQIQPSWQLSFHSENTRLTGLDRSQKASSSLQTLRISCCGRPKACGNISMLRNQQFCIQQHGASAPLCTGVIYTLPLSSPNPRPKHVHAHTQTHSMK